MCKRSAEVNLIYTFYRQLKGLKYVIISGSSPAMTGRLSFPFLVTELKSFQERSTQVRNWTHETLLEVGPPRQSAD